MVSKNKEINVLSVNFKRLNSYKFNEAPLWLTLEDVTLLEFLILNYSLIGYKSYFHSIDKFEKELGIKRRSIESSILKLESAGMITVTIDGFPKVRHFAVNFDIILYRIEELYQFGVSSKLSGENAKLLVQYYKLHVQNAKQEEHRKELNKVTNKGSKEKDIDDEGFAIKKTFSEKELKVASDLLLELEKSFNQRRVIENEKKRAKEKREFAPTALNKSKAIIYKCALALVYKSPTELKHAFMVIADQFLKGHLDHVRNLMQYFFSQKENEEFDVIDYYLNVFNRDYSKEVA